MIINNETFFNFIIINNETLLNFDKSSTIIHGGFMSPVSVILNT